MQSSAFLKVSIKRKLFLAKLSLHCPGVCGGYLPLRQVLFVAWIVLLPVVFASSLSLGFEDARAIATLRTLKRITLVCGSSSSLVLD